MIAAEFTLFYFHIDQIFLCELVGVNCVNFVFFVFILVCFPLFFIICNAYYVVLSM